MSDSNRMDVVVLGITIGTASGWDETTDFGLTFYDFEAKLSGILEGDLYVDFQSGALQVTPLDGGDPTLNVPAFGFLKQTLEHG